MRAEIARLVHPVIAYGLHLKERLGRGEGPDLTTEMTALRGLMLSEEQARQWPDFGGDGTGHFLGVRYALACWLDEIFILDSPWGEAWNARKIEDALYHSNDRAWKFWEQAERAASWPDALEVYYLCMLLGFRGIHKDNPAKLAEYRHSWEGLFQHLQQKGPELPPDSRPPMNVRPMHGRERFQKMVLAWAVALLVLVPVVAALVVLKLGRNG
jgi:type VI secretion system protein ImpK